jgi:hypothetical protein
MSAYGYGGGGGYNHHYGGSSYGMGAYGKSEKELVKECLSSPIVPKDERTKFYLVSTKWLVRWKEYVNFDVEGPDPRPKEEVQALHPGEIDNMDLYDSEEDNELRKGLLEKIDYELLTEQAWQRLNVNYKVMWALQHVRHDYIF